MVLAISTSAFAQPSAADVCAPATELRIATLFNRWSNSPRTLGANKIPANYAGDGVLLATASNAPHTPRQQSMVTSSSS
ncbi:hypothetical protein [Variovorax sp. E3]|uniref:hypothetical protein n=1 Tax=Variovorax sp. E3 TaxID=1914993 RepID=UPI0022B63B1D|nr:hypothetical protein [Variovorax sp. E3]